MLPSCSPSHDWLSESEPLLFDDEFCQSLIKDLQANALPTPPHSPPLKPGMGKPLSSMEQLELVSELLLEDSDFFHLNWNCADLNSPVSEDCLWPCAGEKQNESEGEGEMEEKLSSVLSTSPLLSDIDTQIFAEIAGSTLDCHNAALACHLLESEDLLLGSPEQSESSSDYGSLSAGGESSASDSEEEIDVVTVRRCNTLTRSQYQQQQEDNRREQLRALKRCHLEIQQQHNYAAPRPASPPPPSLCTKRSRSTGDSLKHTGRSRNLTTRHSADTEDEEERRRTHNVMERQRRNELKNCFLRLRDNVPELSNNDKASKVVILKRAKESIWNLESEDQRLNEKKDRLRQRHERLKARLEQLKQL
ncbi:myelocytomatosis oncogene homolog [Pygocentrus nattereri]|uniref:BHLH domain-containing protein n=1 Tax=Pygocentrus nattereri TaxID=42514 RepID=A0A3B4DTM3_PYGNA|nr:myelocytomatosis oncogene homolog [Pygocentrus nattereri]